jgi:hypothetical protein
MCCHEFLHKAILSWYAVFLLDAPASGAEINQARISESSHGMCSICWPRQAEAGPSKALKGQRNDSLPQIAS